MDYGLDQAQSNPESIYTEPTRFAYEFIRIKTDRSDTTIDVKDVVSEFTIFEHIDKPFLTAKMILMDIDPNISLIDTIHFLGTEKVEIKIRVGPGSDQAITKNFVVTEIVTQQKGGDGNEVLVLDLVEDCAYLSSLAILDVYSLLDKNLHLIILPIVILVSLLRKFFPGT